jgi:MFS family permease
MSAAPVRTARVRRYQWITVGLLLAVGVLNILDRTTLSVAGPEVSADLHLSHAQMGLLLSAFSWAYAFAQLPLGAVLDGVGARVVLGAGLFVWSTAQLLCGFVMSLPQFLAARVGLGLGEAPTYPAGVKLIADWFNPRERGAPTGAFLCSPTIAPIIGPPVITLLMASLGWRPMFTVLGLAGIALAAVWYAIARDRRNVALSAEDRAWFGDAANSGEAAAGFDFGERRGLFGQMSTWGIMLGFVGVIYLTWLYLTWLPGYLRDERHLSMGQAGWVASVPYVFGAFGALFGGWLADALVRRGMNPIVSRKWPICAGLVGSAGFTIPAARTPGMTACLVYLCLAMFFLYMANAGAWALVNVAAPVDRVATVGSLQNFCGYLGGSFAPIVTGWLVDATHSFVPGLVIGSGFALGAAMVYFLLVTGPIRGRMPSKSET